MRACVCARPGSLAWGGVAAVDQVELEALYDQYKSLATVEQGINQKTFDRCLGPLGFCKNLVTERIFKFFDRDEDGIINFVDLASGLSVLCKGTQEEKIICACILLQPPASPRWCCCCARGCSRHRLW